jgi:uncharacterized membrane protein
MSRIISHTNFSLNRAFSSAIAIIALIDCAFTGSWVAAAVAIAFGIVDVNWLIYQEAWECAHDVDRRSE